MLPFSVAVSNQIRLLLQSLNDSNFDSIFCELCQFAEYGSEGTILLVQTCLDQVKLSSEEVQNLQLERNLVSAIFKFLLDRPYFSTVFSESLKGTLMGEGFLKDLSSTLNLSEAEKVGIGLALSDSEIPDLKMRGQNFCVSQIEELCANPSSILSDERIQDIVMFLYQSEGLSKHIDSFTKIVSLLQLKDSTSFLPTTILTNDISVVNSWRHSDLFSGCYCNDFESVLAEIEKEMNMADVMTELGYGCTINTSHCKEMLSLFHPLNEVTLSKLLGTIARTHSGLEDAHSTYATFCAAVGSSSESDSSLLNSWNVDVLVDSIKQLAPETNWTHVMENLDHEGFNIPDEKSFYLLMSIYSKACQDPFPLHAVCGSVWKNAEGQLSFLKYAVSAPPDLFTFAHCSRQLTFADSSYLMSKQGNRAWLCLDLLEVLCQLAERGHVSSVRLMLEQPLAQCPEFLLVGVGHVNTAYNLLQYEVSSTVLPVILKDSTKNGIIHHLWCVNPNLVLRGFVDAHTDPSNLLRILDICLELKILLPVLDATPFPFSIKLAAIASQKDQINLEKWLNEHLSVYKDAFCEDCFKFLKEVLSNEANDVPDSSVQQHRAAILNVYQETCSTFFKVLQAHSGQLISHQLVEEIKRLHVSSNLKIQNAVTTDATTSDGSSDAIEAEANTYFHQMFSGQLSIDAMVQMLACFKESSDKREQMIFDCMIANLFEEYKFFPEYPDRQLKIAAVLFGSIIKHQLVTHLTLGIALRGVLDALRKSVDSMMFMFGTKALEQFMDRLVQWPQYCNHILQISHLHGTHAELVSAIERALARTSSSLSESTCGNSLSTDEQQGSGPASVESVEASEASWQLMGSASTQLGRQISSLQLQKSSTMSANSKPLLSHTSQSAIVSAHIDSAANQKATVSQFLQATNSHHSTGVTTAVSSSSSFVRARSIAPAGMLRQPSYSIGFGAALNIETLVAAAERRDTPIEVPVPEVQDKILFMINNISTSNMDAKAKEFSEVLKEQYYPWFAQYMVMKRASIEPNFHDMYLKFLDKVNSKSLNKELVKATYENCKVLLRSNLIKSSSEERSLLKNLGSWLGKFTIGRNQALRAKDIDPKVLIMEAYEKGLMIAVIPFTSKILEPCHSSLAYRPPNPWTMGILSLLAEIYNLPNLKMNLKFEIEVLFKNLGVDMKEVMPTSLLKDRVREVRGNPDFSNKDVAASRPPVIAEVNSGVMPTLSHVEMQPDVNSTSHPASHPNILAQYTSPHLASNTMVEYDKAGCLIVPEHVPSGQGLSQVTQSPSPFSLSQLLTIIPNSDSYININPKLSSIGSQLQFHRIIQAAMDRAIREIVSPVIQRSVTIASRTTKELVLKDYAMESDDGIISRAAHLMVGTLAGSLAHVTCKEPLRAALSSHLRSLLQTLNITSERMEQIIQILTTDHLDLGCALIENVASEKAVELIDGEIGPSFAALRKQRETSGSAYYNAGTYAQGPFARVPESLRPKPGRLSLAQQQVYNDFIKNIWQDQSSQNSSAVSSGPPGLAGSSSNPILPRIYASSSAPLNSNAYLTSQVAPFRSIADPLDMIAEESDHGSTQLLSSSPSHIGADDNVIQHGGRIDSVAVSFPATATCADLQELGSVVPLSPTTSAADRLGTVLPESMLNTGDVLDKYQQVAQKLEALVAKDDRDTDIQGIVAEVPDIILRCVSRDEAALAVAQKAFKSLYEDASNGTHVASYLAILAAIRDVCKLVVKELTSWVIYSDEERKFNIDITIGLIRSELLNLAEYDVHLAKLIDGGRNKVAMEFAMSIVQALVVQGTVVSTSELYNVMETLTKLALRPGSPESLQQLVEIARNSLNTAPNFTASEKARQSRDNKKILSGRFLPNREDYNANDPTVADPAGFRDQVAVLFGDWCQICDLPTTNDSAYSRYISQLEQSGLLKGDDITDRFFRILMELSVSLCILPEQVSSPGLVSLQSVQQLQQLQQLPYFSIDSYAKLVALVLKYCSVDQGSSKAILLPRILSVTVRVIQKDAEEKKLSFNPRPYFRLFINWLLDLASPDPVPDGANFQVLTSFANALHALQPMKVPGWSFAWLELLSHRNFMPKLLMCNSPKGWPFFQRLLVDLFKFMEPHLRNAELGEPVRFLYKGTLRVLLVLLHDFPEFLCDYHFSFCDVIPPSCIQMRNVILSAFPRDMRLPDPYTPNLKVGLLAEISQSPRILYDVDSALKAKQIKAEIDEYLKTRSEGSPSLTELKQRLLLPQNEANLAGTRYNVPLINSLVLYVGMQAIQQLQSKSTPQHAPAQQMTHSPPMDIFLVGAAMDIFQSLIKNLDTEGRYLFLNAVANQLRYPNNHTHYFSFVLLYLFAEANQDIIQEQITRVLLERLIVHGPHPWGLLVTFIELIKNPRYSFWNRSFARCTPEIEMLFEAASRSCGGPKAMDDGMVSSGISDGNH
ncbi:CCR4-NOT transcription complex subunit 1-like isoform X2 [Phoenix dactylifera]|uniref:CCR4-NOT transcription complex subunit 1-like isoform X2 n=1 Tax=Phoenix dactylifera TaxID=42345 RepID=A0A8B7CCA3_PHODC|nr:CCR4-NOT transcription complex subunit 1-like isoform X2 [Phoenix dactylifera]